MGGLFTNRWLVVAASVCGLLVGSGPILIFSSGVFLKPVSAELGITRGDLSSAVFLAAICTAIACPVLGWLLDRFGTRRVMMPGVLLYALVVAGFGLMQTKPAWVGVALLPPFLAMLIGEFGWRHAYFGLGLAVLVLAWLPVALFVREPPALAQAAAHQIGANLTDTLPRTAIA